MCTSRASTVRRTGTVTGRQVRLHTVNQIKTEEHLARVWSCPNL